VNFLGWIYHVDLSESFDLTPIFVSRLCSTKKSTVFASKPITNTVFSKICLYKMFNSWTIKFLKYNYKPTY
jgi:hypothetical protein